MENSDCSPCNRQREDTIHIARDCRVSKKVWIFLLSQQLYRDFFNLGLGDWLLSNLKFKGSLGEDRHGRKHCPSVVGVWGSGGK